MISRRLPALRPLLQTSRAGLPSAIRPTFAQLRYASHVAIDEDVLDPTMNGGYTNPPPVKRALRDPYADWWDKQERRNFGEPIHEDNDILAIFSTEPYTHTTPGHAGLLFGTFVLAVFGLCGVVYTVYPDKPSVPRTFGDGLKVELGGDRAKLAKKSGEDSY